jgi:hypothetical protein
MFIVFLIFVSTFIFYVLAGSLVSKIENGSKLAGRKMGQGPTEMKDSPRAEKWMAWPKKMG